MLKNSKSTHNHLWKEIHSLILTQFLNELNHKKLKYFILRNYENLPTINTSKDVDIVIEPGSYKKVSNLLFTILKKNGISHYYVVKYERVRCWYGIDVYKKFSIHIDLIEGYLSKGFEVFPFHKLHENTVRYNDFVVLNRSFDAVMLLYYKIIGTRQLQERYRRKISSIYLLESQKINAIITDTLNKRCSREIIKELRKKNFDGIIKNAKFISKVSKRKTFIKKPVKTICNVTKFLIEKFYRIVICPRSFQNFIAVEGADGTGKSTFIEGLAQAIGFYYVSDESKSHIYHHRPTLLPNLGAIGEKAGVMKEDKNFTTPHRAKPAGFISSFIRMTYYWVDYFVGVPIKLRKDVQFDRFTIYDRYIYDFLIDPHRSRINLPYWLRKKFTKLVIQPRIVFILLADAETIYKRKQELTVSEIKRQLGEFSRLAKSEKRFVVIDASKSPEEMVEQAIKIIVEKFTEKII